MPSLSTWLVGLLALVFLFYGVALWRDVAGLYRDRATGHTEQGAHEDYVSFYAAGRMVMDGRGDELYNIDSIAQAERDAAGRPVGGTGILAYFNPPFVAAAFAPLTALPLRAASLILGALALASAVASAYALDRLLRLESWPQRVALWLGFFSLNSVVRVVAQGQLSMVVLLGWLWFVLLQTKGQERLSGVALALVLVKPQMALLPLAILVWKRRWQTLLPFSVIAVLLVLVSIAVSGPEVLVQYPRFLIESTGWVDKWGITPASMFSWNGLAIRMLGGGAGAHALTLVLVVVTLLIAIAFAQGPWQPIEPRFFALGGAALMASLLMSPHLFVQDLSLVALAVALGAACARRGNGGFGWWVALAFAVWATQLYSLRALDQGGFNIATPLMAIVFAMLALSARYSNTPASTNSTMRSSS